jgi:hypothetical protein
MSWTKAAAVLVAACVFAMPVAAFANDATATATTIQDYAAREAQAKDLEQFTGGFHGLVLTVLVVGLVVWLIFELFGTDHDHDDHRHRHHDPVHP